MKPANIKIVMDTALEARKIDEINNPLFTGEAGLGKSQIVQQWVKDQRQRNPNFGFIDLRIAYMEAPDLIGLPENELLDGTKVTSHYQPDFWPRDPDSEGLLLLEEPNRGTTGVMNCLMQLLTDRKVHKYELPKGWIIAGCVNPDSSEYDVNTMDAALKDRFEEFEVEFDAVSFMDFIDKSDWHPNVQMFINSGMWIYKTTKEIAQGAKYISPRTWSKMNAAEKSGVGDKRSLHRIFAQSILGKDIGNEYHKFCFDQAPVTAQDILKDRSKSFDRLTKQSDPNAYQGEMIAQTIESIEKHYGGLKKDCKPDQIDEDTMAEVAKIIPSDHAVNLIKACGYKQYKGNVTSFFQEFVKRHPDLIKVLKSNIRVGRATGVDKPTK